MIHLYVCGKGRANFQISKFCSFKLIMTDFLFNRLSPKFGQISCRFIFIVSMIIYCSAYFLKLSFFHFTILAYNLLDLVFDETSNKGFRLTVLSSILPCNICDVSQVV